MADFARLRREDDVTARARHDVRPTHGRVQALGARKVAAVNRDDPLVFFEAKREPLVVDQIAVPAPRGQVRPIRLQSLMKGSDLASWVAHDRLLEVPIFQ